MRQRITWLVVATTSAIVAAFVIPLCIMVAGIAADRATARAREQAQNVAALVGSGLARPDLTEAVRTLAAEGPAVLVVTADGSLLGTDGVLRPDTATAVEEARASLTARTVRQDHGVDSVVPVAGDDGTLVVVATVPEAELRAGVPVAWATLITLGLVLVGVSAAAARGLARRVSTPVTGLGVVAHRLTEGDLTARAAVDGPPETAEVGQALNRLAERIEGLVAAERESAADLAHRLRTPVTQLRLAVETFPDPEVGARLQPLVDNLHRGVDAVVRDARREVREALPHPTELAPVVLERARYWAALAEDQGRAVTVDDVATTSEASRAVVALSARDLAECVDILFDNVFTHTPEGAAVRVTVGAGQGRAWFEVADGGPGLPTSYAGRGHSGAGSTGLGLDIVGRMAEQAGGELSLTRSDLGGLAARVELPQLG